MGYLHNMSLKDRIKKITKEAADETGRGLASQGYFQNTNTTNMAQVSRSDGANLTKFTVANADGTEQEVTSAGYRTYRTRRNRNSY